MSAGRSWLAVLRDAFVEPSRTPAARGDGRKEAPANGSAPPDAHGEATAAPGAPGARSARRGGRAGRGARRGGPAGGDDAVLRPVGVVGATAHAVAVALAVARMRRARADHAVLCTWPAPAGPAGEATAAAGAARRAAERLAGHGQRAVATGRVVRVALPEDEALAAAAARRVLALAGDVPVVVHLAGARGAALDALLGDLDRVLLVPPPGATPELVDLAAAGIARHAPVRTDAGSTGPLDYVLARGGRARRALGRRAEDRLGGPPDAPPPIPPEDGRDDAHGGPASRWCMGDGAALPP